MSKLITAILLLSTFLLPPKGWSQEGMETPSSAGRDISALKETAKTKLKTLGGRRSVQVAEDPLAMPLRKPERPEGPNVRRYSSAGKRDPFRPFILELRPKRRRRENLSPLERVEVSQLKLVGIIWDIPEPRAMVEDTAGLGYVIKIGTPIGRNDGTVKVIAPKEVVIEENFFDFYGAKKSREVKLRLVNE
ncbi:MAG: pilus assembly protein PilP [Deltaproteobacteria bacterium]|nr:pilus assembly protein PilP [Deltaproteobacteria bacterium]